MIFFVRYIQEAVPNLLADFISLAIFVRAAEVFLPPNIIGSISSFLLVALFLRSHMSSLFGLLLLPKGSLFSRGSKILGGDDPRLRVISWEVFYLPSCFVVQRQKKYLGISSLISDGLTSASVFPLHSVK